MKRLTRRRILSLFFSMLMIVSIIPANFNINSIVVKAATGSTTGADGIITWDAATIVDLSTADKGLSVNDTWTTTTASATDTNEFSDGVKVAGTTYAVAGANKAMAAGKTAAGVVPDSGCFIKYTASENGTLAIYEKTAKASTGSSKTFYIVDATGATAGSKVNTTTSSVYDIVTAPVTTGQTYYAYMGGSTANVWQVVFTPASAAKTQTAWSNVATPTVDKVTTDTDGNFVVDFTSVIDQYAGAEDVKISMLESGYEVSSQTITSQKGEVTFQPLWSGNYTFVAVAQRTGEADKLSAVYSYPNYVLAVNKPTITWAQNKGNGSVYLDWVNIKDADSYAVGYKVSGTSDYTMLATSLSKDKADYTLSGLTVGQTYDIIVKATRNSDNFTSTATKTVTVTASEDQPWSIATVGSEQNTSAVVTDASGAAKTYTLGSGQTTATSIANTSGDIAIAGQSSGKISDDEDGFSYYYTKINPNTENFKLSATFKITDTSLTPDNQTGFGVVAADTLGVNNWGTQDIVHKYFNYTSAMMFSSKSTRAYMRTVTGYTSADSSNNDGVDRSVANTTFNNTKSDFTVGTTYNFALEKTDKGYTATCNGEALSLSDNSFTSVQEDGTVCVGVMVSRKVSVDISNIAFTKSASAGVTVVAGQNSKVTPSATVYSSETCGSTGYSYIYQPNCSGKLTVKGPSGAVINNQAVTASEVVRVTVPVSIGTNAITATFIPDAGTNIASINPVVTTTNVDCEQYGTKDQTIIVAADGTAAGQGTEASPLDLATAVQFAQPGQTIYLKDGTYTQNITIKRSVSGTAEKNITMVAQSDKVVFNGVGLTVIGDYWHIYGLHIKNSTGVGIQICGNYNTIDMCTVEASANTGVQISRSGNADNTAGIKYQLWPTGNLIKNCESFNNCDAAHNDADGFAAKLTCGNDNKFFGCISHNNIDDGWDLYAKSVSGQIGAVTIENCVAYDNGWLTTDDTTAAGYVYGEGNGFKLGGGYLKGGHVLKNSISFNNHGKGITSNSCPDCQIINCISYNNSEGGSEDAYNVGLNAKDSSPKPWVVTGLISLCNSKNTSLEDAIPFSLHNADNYISDGSASYNNQGVQAVESWFENVNTVVTPVRNADGSINMHGLLALNATAPATSGARLDTTSVAAISIQPQKTTVVSGKTSAGSGSTDNGQTGTGGNGQTGTGDNGQTGTTDNGNSQNGGGTTDSGSDSDTNGSETTVTLGKVDDNNVIADAKLEAGAIVKDAEGHTISTNNIKIVVTPVSEQSTVNAVQQAFTKNSIALKDGSTIKYYSIGLMNSDKVQLKMTGGKALITFAYPAGTNSADYVFTVYHLNDSGILETLTPSLSGSGLTVETDGFSPYAVVYTEKSVFVADSTSTVTSEQSLTDNTIAASTSAGVLTGDTSHISLFATLGGIAVIVLLVVASNEVIRRKKIRQ